MEFGILNSYANGLSPKHLSAVAVSPEALVVVQRSLVEADHFSAFAIAIKFSANQYHVLYKARKQ